MPGRWTPGNRRMDICAAATHAPVLPAEMMTSQRSSLDRLDPSQAHFTIELSVLLRSAETGESPISMTCVVATISRCGSCWSLPLQAFADDRFVADEHDLVAGIEQLDRAERSLEDRIGRVVASITSIAIRTAHPLGQRGIRKGERVLAFVARHRELEPRPNETALSARIVRELGRATAWAGHGLAHGKCVVGSAVAASGTGLALLGEHGWAS